MSSIEMGSIVGGALFLKLDQKTRRKGILFKISKKKSYLRSHTIHILFFGVSSGYLNLELF